MSHTNTQDNEYYNTLGVSRTATKKEIQKAYRKKALKCHPDRHFDNKDKYKKEFQKLSEAYNVLKDDNKRQLYDEYGKSALSNQIPDFEQLYQMFFDDASNEQHVDYGKPNIHNDNDNKSYTTTSTIIELICNFSLIDVYWGKKNVILNYSRTTGNVCSKCDGISGDKQIIERTRRICKQCKGTGKVSGWVRKNNCKKCVNGKTVHDKVIKTVSEKCTLCDGNGYEQQQEEIVVNIKPGMKDGSTSYYHGIGNEEPECLRGDVIVVFKQIKDSRYKRINDNDLFTTIDITQQDAINYYTFNLSLPNKQYLKVMSYGSTNPISDGDIKVLRNVGLPFNSKKLKYGNIYIKFNISYNNGHGQCNNNCNNNNRNDRTVPLENLNKPELNWFMNDSKNKSPNFDHEEVEWSD
eukprot:256281_1